MNGPWILTCKVADHNQHGEYFVAVFWSKPSEVELLEMDFKKDDIDDLFYFGSCGDLDGQGSREWFLRKRNANVDYFEEHEGA
jgi:hypothetical protein